MRKILLILLLAVVSGRAAADIYECEEAGGGKSFTADKAEAEAKKCKQLTVTPTPPPVRKPPTAQQIVNFRRNIKSGDSAWQGLVVEVKPPVAMVQPARGQARWYRIDELVPEY